MSDESDRLAPGTVSKSLEPITLYGSAISYYTGKLEGYLRYKEIPYRFVPVNPTIVRRLRKETGADQVPAVELPDGRLMTDTTPMIDWFEAHHREHSVIPADPLQGFVCRMIEDYAEEWLWRPAMHFRWPYPADAALLSRKAVDEILRNVPLPKSFLRAAFRFRQRTFYVRRDGVGRDTWDHVEGIYYDTLCRLSDVFAKRPFLFGALPTLADFGFFASMFRHFSQDPTPAEYMRQHAPAVYDWQARLWNARGSRLNGDLVDGVPDDLGPFLRDMGEAYLPYLCSNAEAFLAGESRHDAEIQGIRYRSLPVSQYRVWCLERLRAHYEALPEGPRAEARTLLEAHDGWEPLWRVPKLDSCLYPEDRVPFQGRKVHYDLRKPDQRL